MKNSGVIIAVIVVLVLGAGVFALTKNKDKASDPGTGLTNAPQTVGDTAQAQSSEQSATSTEASSADTITYSDSGFSPATLTVKSGTTVTIKNDSSRILEFESDPHPDHTDEPELNAGTVSPGKSMTFTVTKTGSHGYHNHLNDDDKGKIVVQ